MYLWVNITDLSLLPQPQIALLPVQERLGDQLLPGAYYKADGIDENYLVVNTSTKRAGILRDYFKLVQKQHRVKIRTKVTERLPGHAWQYVSERSV